MCFAQKPGSGELQGDSHESDEKTGSKNTAPTTIYVWYIMSETALCFGMDGMCIILTSFS